MFQPIEEFLDLSDHTKESSPRNLLILSNEESQQQELESFLQREMDNHKQKISLGPQDVHPHLNQRSHANPYNKFDQELSVLIDSPDPHQFGQIGEPMDVEQSSSIFSDTNPHEDQVRSVQEHWEQNQIYFPLEGKFHSIDVIEKLSPKSFGSKAQNSARASTDLQTQPIHSQPSLPSAERSSENSSDLNEKVRRNLIHLRNSRRKKGKRNHLQQLVKGYWTKNLLTFAKRVHFEFIEKIKGKDFLNLEENGHLLEIYNKAHITLLDYVTIYQEEQLKGVWDRFFRTKHMHRQLTLSNVSPNRKKIYLKFLDNFQVAYVTKEFNGLTKVPEVVPDIDSSSQ